MSSVESFQIHLSSALADRYNDGLTSDCEFYLPVIEIPIFSKFIILCKTGVILDLY